MSDVNWWKLACLAHPIGWAYLVGDTVVNGKNPFIKEDSGELNIKGAYNSGTVFFKQGKYTEAIQHFSVAINADSNYGIAYANRGVAYANLKQYHLALNDLHKAVRLLGDARTYGLLGNVYACLEKYDLAIQNYNSALKLEPNDPYILFNRGSAYGNCGYFREALADMEQAIARFDLQQKAEESKQVRIAMQSLAKTAGIVLGL